MKMKIEITRFGFQLFTEKGELVMEAEPANKGKLHRWLSNNGFKPHNTDKATDEWEK